MFLTTRRLIVVGFIVIVSTTICCADLAPTGAETSTLNVSPSILAMSGQGGCLLHTNGVPVCWTSPPVSTFDPSEGQLRFTTIVGTWANSCGLTTDSLAYCWGNNVRGLVGDGTSIVRQDGSSTLPTRRATPVTGLHRFVSISMSASACGLESSGSAWCWGERRNGLLGDGKRVESGVTPVPVKATSSMRFTEVSAGSTNCALSTSGIAHCWGAIEGSFDGNIKIEPGDCVARFYFWYAGSPCLTPTPVESSTRFATLSGGRCALTDSGTAYCWGSGLFGELGTGTVGTYTVTASQVLSSIKFRTISVGNMHGCALAESGQAYCWGWNRGGQLGIGPASDGGGPDVSPVPIAVSTTATFTHISADMATCALDTSADVWCWGLGYGMVPMKIGIQRH